VWDEARSTYELFTSELTVVEASAGNPEAAARRLEAIADLAKLPIDEEVKVLAELLIAKGGIPAAAEADALHVAVAAVHSIDYLLTWNCRHIDNAANKPIIQKICAATGYVCPEICTPMELMPEDKNNVQR
ncbi:MAG: DNA-binding protein, partial [Candidatus Electrothrix sp. AR3]|nr:DNA-binding protein [Candidatus Electrothrix sp. AR3]